MPGPTEVEMLRDEITREVNKDAFVLSSQIFNQRRPDQSHASNAQYDQLVRQRFLTQDRDWLSQEAQRAPNDFLESVKRIGARPAPPEPPPGLPSAVPMPVLPPAPVAPGLAVPPLGMGGPLASPAPGLPMPLPPAPPAAPLPPGPANAPLMPAPPPPVPTPVM